MISPDEALARIGSTGKAFFHNDIRLVDPAGRDVPPEVPGEVLLRGRHVMAGYWNRPEATADVLRDGWLRTGDCAVMDKDGYIYMQDRIKDMIVSGGENISPAEIEAVLISSPAIADAAVIGIPSARWGESPLAIVVKAVPDLDEAVVVEHCHRMLARYKAPKRVVLANVIPRNPAGKVLKRLLRDQFATWVTE
jgi:acyl-CoA synthetase (AMP-forming)/AMP-acid ligase II